MTCYELTSDSGVLYICSERTRYRLTNEHPLFPYKLGGPYRASFFEKRYQHQTLDNKPKPNSRTIITSETILPHIYILITFISYYLYIITRSYLPEDDHESTDVERANHNAAIRTE